MSHLGIRQSREQVWAVYVFLALVSSGFILNLLSTSFRKSGFHLSFPMSSALLQMQMKHSRNFRSQEIVSFTADYSLSATSFSTISKRFSIQSQMQTLVLKITLPRCTLFYNEFSATDRLNNAVRLRRKGTPLKQLEYAWSSNLRIASGVVLTTGHFLSPSQ